MKQFGSSSKNIKLLGAGGLSYLRQEVFITKTHVKAVNQPPQPCTNDDIVVNKCILGYIEEELGCMPNVQGSEFSEGIACTTMDQLMTLANISRSFEEANDKEIYDATGCLAPCDKWHYSLAFGQLSGGNDDIFRISFKIMDRTYEEREQYIIYDISSFIADVGGYMGLLLGCSLSSLYGDVEAFLRRALCKPRVNSNNK